MKNPCAEIIVGTYEQMLRESLDIEDSWVYRSLSPIPKEFWDDMVSAMGQENVYIATGGYLSGPSGEFVRLSVFISPEGMTNLEKYAKELEKYA